jgi:inorganic pyrophosphatase
VIGHTQGGAGFWTHLDRLLADSALLIDRPRGSAHPRYPQHVYPLDYGYLDGTTAGDGAGIDVWVGSAPDAPGSAPRVGAILCTVDLLKRDAEIKLLIGCTPDDWQAILAFTNGDSMQAAIVVRPD